MRLVLILLSCVCAAPAWASTLHSVTGGGGQVWMCMSTDAGEVALASWSPEVSADTFGLVHDVAVAPSLIGAFGETVWFANVSEDEPHVDVRVLVLQASWSPGRQEWVTRPATGPSRLPARSMPGTPWGLIGGRDGPVLLSADVTPGLIHVSAYRHGQWLDWPALQISPAGTLESVSSGAGLLALHVDDAGQRHVSRLEAGADAWQQLPVEVPSEASVVAWWGETPVVGVHKEDRLNVWMIQGSSLVQMANGQPGGQAAWLVSNEGNLVQVREQAGGVEVSMVNTLRADGTPWVPLHAVSGSSMRFWSIAVTTAIGVSVLLVLIFGRSMEATAFPQGVRSAPLFTRFGAFVLDVIPGIVVVSVCWDMDAGALVRAVLQGPLPGTLAPLLLVAGVCWVWQAGWEGLTGTSPGKRLGRLSVVDLHGQRPSWGRTIVRTGGRSLIVLAVPLAIIIVLTATGQGLGDVLARTVVVRRGPQEPSGDA